MVITAFVMIVIKKDRPGKVGEPVLMRGDSSSAVQQRGHGAAMVKPAQ